MSQSTLAKLLEEKLHAMKENLAEAQRVAREASEKAESLASDYNAFRMALAAELGKGRSNSEVKEEEIPGEGSSDSEINKSKIARELIYANSGRGVTPRDVREAFNKAGVTYHQNYPYAVLRRLRKNRTVKVVKGRYFPVEPKAANE